MLLMIPDIRIYEALGHNKAVREETLFRRLPRSIIHAPYTEGWCSWGRVNDADDHAPAVAILADTNFPTFLITDIKV